MDLQAPPISFTEDVGAMVVMLAYHVQSTMKTNHQPNCKLHK